MTKTHPDLEINGHMMLALLQSINLNNYFVLLEQHDLMEIDPDTWYPLTKMMSLLEDMYKRPGAEMDVISVGVAFAQNCIISDEMELYTSRQFLLEYDHVYQAQHRNGNPGSIQTKQIADDHIILTLVDVPYPNDMSYGLIWGFLRRLSPPGEKYSLTYDEQNPPKSQGDSQTVMHVKWS